jgi:deoxyribodipyrimidine photo-lyase
MIVRNWIPTRDSALKRFKEFLPSAGRYYALERNYDLGTEFNKVSCLSPYVSRRLITEEEILKSVLENFSYKYSEKFIQEVLWRIYWKGWLDPNSALRMYASASISNLFGIK